MKKVLALLALVWVGGTQAQVKMCQLPALPGAVVGTECLPLSVQPSGASFRGTPQAIEKYIQQQVVNLSDYGAALNGTTPDDGAFAAAQTALGAKGGVIRWAGITLLGGSFTLNDGVCLVGEAFPGQITNANYNASNFTSILVINGSTGGVLMGNRTCAMNLLVLEHGIAPNGGFALPFANGTVASAAVTAFTGAAFAPVSGSTIDDIRLENLLVMGFAKLFDGSSATGLNRPIFRNVYGDNTNGILVSNVFDVGRGETLHMWPFTTTNQSFTTGTLNLRTGIAYQTGSSSTWMKWQDAFEYGYAVGHDVNGSQDVRLIGCGADSPTSVSQSNIGFRFRGSIGNGQLLWPQATAQGASGVQINTSTMNGINDITIIGGVFHGANSASGYIDVQAAQTYKILDSFFSDNGPTGQIQIESGVGYGVIANDTFANTGGSTAPIYGDATALTKISFPSPVYGGTYKAWTGPISSIGVQMPLVLVGGLPTCTTALKGTVYAVSDASSPTYGATLTGSSSTTALALCNGSAWLAH